MYAFTSADLHPFLNAIYDMLLSSEGAEVVLGAGDRGPDPGQMLPPAAAEGDRGARDEDVDEDDDEDTGGEGGCGDVHVHLSFCGSGGVYFFCVIALERLIIPPQAWLLTVTGYCFSFFLSFDVHLAPPPEPPVRRSARIYERGECLRERRLRERRLREELIMLYYFSEVRSLWNGGG